MDLNKHRALLNCAIQGMHSNIQSLVNERVDVNAKNALGETALTNAAEHSDVEGVKRLINFGADINIRDNVMLTALHYAACDRSMEIVQFLVDIGADLNVKNVDDVTPLMIAARRSHRGIVELLINSGSDMYCCDNIGDNVLHYASCGGSVEMVQFLVNKGAPINLKNFKGETPLMKAVRFSLPIVELLINSGADIHCCDNRSQNVVHHALDWKSEEIVQCLVNKGAPINVKNLKGKTPLMKAARFSLPIVELLINSGADIHCCDNRGRNVMHHAASSFDDESFQIVKLCIEKGAYVQCTTYNILFECSLLKKAVLQDVKLCSQAVINKFNNRDLPLFYKRFASAQQLPPIDKMKIRDGCGMALQVEQSVAQEVQANGFCNLYKMVPLVLSISCVKTLIENYEPAFNETNLSESRKGLKRFGYNAHEYPCKNIN